MQARVNAEIASQLEALHAPEAWAALLALPADAAATWTGKDRWKISSEERKTLGMTGSAAARCMMITNPRALAFMMLAASMSAIYMPRALAELRDMRAEREAKEKQREAGAKP